jgi:hypothetical protein
VPAIPAGGIEKRGPERFKLAVALEEQLCPSRFGHLTGPS